MKSFAFVRFLALGVALALAAGCPDSRGGGGGGGGPVSIDALPTETADAYCDLLLNCLGGGDDTAGIRLLLADPLQCRDFVRRAFLQQGDFGDLIEQVRGGTVMYDGAAAGACLAEVGRTCAAILSGGSPFESCATVFTGTVAEGGSCFIDEECAGDTHCDHGMSFPEACPGVCRPRVALGEVCFGSDECSREGVSGAVGCEWDEATMSSRCLEVRAEADAGEGQPCGLVSQTSTTQTIRACARGLWCTADESSMGVCRAPIAAGAACTSSDEVCVDGHFCAGGVCRAVTIVRTAGQACDEATLTVCDPLARLACVAGTCQSTGSGTAGSMCGTGDLIEVISCNEGLVCHRDTMTCGAPKPAGAACETGIECDSGDCDSSTMTCRARRCS